MDLKINRRDISSIHDAVLIMIKESSDDDVLCNISNTLLSLHEEVTKKLKEVEAEAEAEAEADEYMDKLDFD